MINLQQIIDYYVDLIILQYNGKPKAKATIELIAQQLLCDGVMFDVRDGFDVETAVGKQLDMLGKIVGVDRYYLGQVGFIDNTFGFTDYDESDDGQQGFSDYLDYDTKVGTMLQYIDVVSSSQMLSDEDFRLLLKLKIVCNNINYSQKSIDAALFDKFGTDLILSTMNDMNITYFANPALGAILDVLIEKDLLPRPMTIGINVIKSEMEEYAFSDYSSNISNLESDDLIEGFSDYLDYDAKVGEMLTYDKIL